MWSIWSAFPPDVSNLIVNVEYSCHYAKLLLNTQRTLFSLRSLLQQLEVLWVRSKMGV